MPTLHAPAHPAHAPFGAPHTLRVAEEETRSRSKSARLLLSIRGAGGAPKFNAAQLWQMLSDYLIELEAEGQLWPVVDAMLSEHGHSLQIDETLEAEQMERLQARELVPVPPHTTTIAVAPSLVSPPDRLLAGRSSS